jgi:hypothetical protein
VCTYNIILDCARSLVSRRLRTPNKAISYSSPTKRSCTYEVSTIGFPGRDLFSAHSEVDGVDLDTIPCGVPRLFLLQVSLIVFAIRYLV